MDDDDDLRVVPDGLAVAVALWHGDEAGALRIIQDIVEVGNPARALRILAGALVLACTEADAQAGREYALDDILHLGAEIEREDLELSQLAQEI